MTSIISRNQIRIFFVIFILIFIHIIKLYGQKKNDLTVRKFSLGIEISPGISKYSSSFHQIPNREFFDYHSYFSFSCYGGAFVDIKLYKMLIMESGLYFSRISGSERYKYKDSFSDPMEYTYHYWYFDIKSLNKNLCYIDVPVLFGINFKRVDFLFGPQFGLNVYSKIKDEAMGCYGTQAQVCENFGGIFLTKVSKYDFGLIGKVTVRLHKRWKTGIRFYYEIYQNNNSLLEMNWNYYNLNLLVSYNIK
jgi:hypothetical protein